MKISSSFGEYSVSIVSNFDELQKSLESYEFRGAIIDSQVLQKYWNKTDFLSTVPTLEVTASENAKSYQALGAVFEWMANNRFDRKSKLLAVGGGTIQDIATFAAATFHRGIEWTYVPTTLLSQADSCIGGKCGINLSSLKNQVGLVYPPTSIYADTSFLLGLGATDLISGMGEILKICVTGEGQFWSEYKDLVDGRRIHDLDFEKLTSLALLAKKYVIEEDEMELNFRRVLNYGHTIGHAIEAASSFQIPHGIGVIMGIKAISILGRTWGLTPIDLGNEVIARADDLLRQYEKSLDFDATKAIEMLNHDKKASAGSILFVVLRAVGQHEFVSRPYNSQLMLEVREALDNL